MVAEFLADKSGFELIQDDSTLAVIAELAMDGQPQSAGFHFCNVKGYAEFPSYLCGDFQRQCNQLVTLTRHP